MQFEKGNLYHIYNQGNNHQVIFFNRKNYLFFLKKIKVFVAPYADILAWCLMPNHFHLMVLVNFEELPLSSEGFASSETLAESNPAKSETLAGSDPAKSETLAGPKNKTRTLNNSIGIMLRSYTNAINKEQKRSGALFRKKTKAECITCTDGITPAFFNTLHGTQINILDPDKQYPQMCFNYIHQNPVKAGLVNAATDWEFSSAKDYTGFRNGKLINKNIAEEYIDF